MAPRNPSGVYPVRLKAYCPLRADSFPVGQARGRRNGEVVVLALALWSRRAGVGQLERNVSVSAAVGVPVIFQLVPEPLMLSQLGRVDPLATVHV